MQDGTLEFASGERDLVGVRVGLVDTIRGLEERAGLEEEARALGPDEGSF